MNNKGKKFTHADGKEFMLVQDEDGFVYEVRDFFTGEAPEEVPGKKPLKTPEEHVFECEHYEVSKVLKLPVDAILDLYNDYHILFQLTNETKFEARAKAYMTILKLKTKKEVA